MQGPGNFDADDHMIVEKFSIYGFGAERQNSFERCLPRADNSSYGITSQPPDRLTYNYITNKRKSDIIQGWRSNKTDIL